MHQVRSLRTQFTEHHCNDYGLTPLFFQNMNFLYAPPASISVEAVIRQCDEEAVEEVQQAAQRGPYAWSHPKALWGSALALDLNKPSS